MIRPLFRQKCISIAALWMLAALQFGCSGGGGDILAGGGIGGTGVTVASVGTVSGFGSVIVNGVVYDTTVAEVFVENVSRGSGDAAVIGSLSPGMVVRVEGWFGDDGSARADRVFFSRDLKGAVESVSDLDPFSKEVVILGQVILMDDRTVFRNGSIGSVAPGTVLEVSGYEDDAGRILATYVNRIADFLAPGEPVEIKGVIQGLVPPLQTFELRGLTVDYGLSDLSGLPGNAPEEGRLIKVRGRLEAPDLLIAERIESEEVFGVRAFDVVDLEGIITQVGVPGGFKIGRYTVTVDEETLFNNMTPEDLNYQGTRVVVHGVLKDRGILADEVFLPEKIRVESNVGSINPVERSLVPAGLEPAEIRTTATTRIAGIAQGFDDIAPGHHVRVLGRLTAGGDIVASTLVVTPSTPSRDRVELSGPVESINEPFLVILSVEVNTAFIPSGEFKDREGNPLLPAEFFGLVRPGDGVTVRGALEAGSVNWKGIVLDN